MRAYFRVKSIPMQALLAATVLLVPMLSGCQASVYDLVGRGDLGELEQRLNSEPELVHARNALRKTPLHYAVTYRQPKAMTVLIGRGAEVNAQDDTGLTPLHTAALLGRMEEAQILLDAGADIVARDGYGDTPLHSAAMRGNQEMIEFLLRHGADALAQNLQEKTPRDLARRERRDDLADFLESVERGLNQE